MSSLVGVQAVLFDLDGTLVDSLSGIQFSINEALNQEGMPSSGAELKPLIGPPVREILGRLCPQAGEQQLSRLEKAFRSSYDLHGWQKTTLHDNAVLTLSELKRLGLHLFVATNKPALATKRILEALGIAHFFTEVLSRDSRTPPFARKSEMLIALLERYQLRAKECFYVGDTNEDVLAGREAGVPVVLVAHNSHQQSNGSVLQNLSEILEIVRIKQVA